MKYVQLGKSSIKISKIGFGSRNLVQKFRNDMNSLHELISSSIDLGITFFIAASHYSDGVTEKLMGDVLSEYRDEIVLATSVGVIKTADGIVLDISPESLRKQINTSLNNLQTDSLDLLQLHYANPLTDNQTTREYLTELLSSGIIKSIGLSNFNLADLKEWFDLADSVQMPYNPIQREIEGEYLNYCNKHAITLLAYTPLLAGLFSDRVLQSGYIPEIVNYLPDKKDSFLQSVQVLSEAAAKVNKTIPEVILAWMSNLSEIGCILVGTTNIDHLKSNVSAIDSAMSQRDMDIINKAFVTIQSLFPEGITYPLPIDKIHLDNTGQKFASAMGMWFRIPPEVKIGDTVIINDTLGEVISVLPA
ncbi:MAG: aldo/keto reductase [Candidatus Hermodarchaeota archaeon]